MAAAGELRFVITVDNKGAVTNIKTMGSQMGKLEKGTSKVNKSMGSFAKTIRRAFVAAGIALAIKKTMDFNKEIALTATMMPGLDNEVEKLKSNVQDLSIQYGKSTIDMAQGAYLVVSAFGAQAASSQKLEITAKAAAAGNAQTSASLSLLSAVTKGYGDVSDEAFQKASDLAFQTVVLGQTDFPQLAAAIGKVVPVAAAMGIKQEELFAGFATLTGVTGTAAEVTTQLSGIIRAFIKPTEGMKEAILDLGKGQFTTAEGMLAKYGMVGALRKLIENTDGTAVSIGKLFRRAEALPAVFALSSGQADVFDEKLIKMYKSAGATDLALKEITDGVNKTGFSLEQAKQAFVVFTQKVTDSTLQSDEFNDALQGVKRAFESKEFIDAISSITKAIATFVSKLVEGIAAFAEWVQQSANTEERFKSQAGQWKDDFVRIATALNEAGMSFEEYEKITSRMASSKAIFDLTKRQKELKEELARIGPAFANTYNGSILVESATKELNIVNAERNDLLVNQLHEMIKNNEQYGISAEVIAKTRAILQGKTAIQKKDTDALNENTDEIVENSSSHSEIEKIMKKYNISVSSATVILKKQKPELAEITGLQKELGVSLEEATKVYGILNNLELGRKRVLKDINITMPKVIENYAELDDAIKLISDKYSENIDKAEDEKRALEELNEVIEGGSESFAELAGTVRETADEMANSAGESTLLGNILREISKIEMSEYFGAMSMALDVLGDAMGENNEVFDNFKNIGKSLASGNYLGAVAAAIQHVTYVLGPAGLTGGAELATEALSNLGVTSQEAIGELTNLLEKYVEANSLFSSLDDPEEYWENFAKYAEDAAKKVAEDTAEYYEKAFDAAPALADYLKVSATSQTEFNDQVNITLGLFANMMKSGASITEVMSTMGDSFDALIASQEANKWAADDTFKALSEFRTLIKNNEELVKSVEGFNAVLQMTAELGKMDQDQFESYGRSTVAQFDKLRNAGFSQNQSLLMMAPSLKILSDQAEEYGLKLDANTQSLIDQAKQQGMFDEMADPLDTIADILKTIGEALGADMSEFQKLDSTINSAAENSSNDIQQIDMEMVKLGENTTNTAKTMSGDIDAFAEMSADSMKGFAGESVGAMTMLAEGSVNAMTTLSDGTNNAANSMKSGFDDASKKSLDSIRNFVNAANKELGKLGQNNGFPQPPLNPPQRNIPKFATGGGGIVPPGFNNDDFLIGVSSGEEFKVTPSGGNMDNSRTIGDVNMTVVVQASSGDSVDTLTNKLIQAVRVNGQNIVGELEKAGL